MGPKKESAAMRISFREGILFIGTEYIYLTANEIYGALSVGWPGHNWMLTIHWRPSYWSIFKDTLRLSKDTECTMARFLMFGYTGSWRAIS